MVWVTYGWMIDDVALSETPANNIELFDETFGGWFLANPSTTGDMGIPYTFNPLAQAQANPYRFEGIIINKGLNDQNNTQLNVDVTGSTGASVFSGNSTPSTLVSGDTSVVGLSSTFTPTTYGSYNCSFWASTDNILGTDTVTRSTIVTDTVYGRDYDWNYDGSAVGGQVTAGRDCGDQVVGNAFEIYAAANVTSISFFVHENSIAGATVKVEMYTYDPLLSVSQSAPIWLEESDDYTLQVSDINKWVTLPLRNPLSIVPNASGDTAYIAAVYGFQGFSGDTSIIATSGSDGAVSYKYGWAYNDNCTQTKSWTGIGNTLMIRMNFGTIDPPSSVFDKFGEGSDIQVYPNPNNGNFSIQFLNVEADDYTVIVKDILGKQVFEKEIFAKGVFNDNVDLSLLNKGVYLLTVSNGNHELTQKVILE